MAQRAVEKQILQALKIKLNPSDNRFEYDDSGDLSFLYFSSQIPVADIKKLAVQLQKRLEILENTTEPHQVADILESSFDAIRRIDTMDKPQRENLKKILKQEFIYAAAKVIQNKTDWKEPSPHVDRDTLRTFICEVFLKQQLLGHQFCRMRPKELLDMPDAVFNSFLYQERKQRQLEIVRTSKYLFAISPAYMDKYPYSPRRLLLEEKLFGRSSYCVISHTVLHPTQKQAAVFQERLLKILSVIGNVSTEIIDAVEHLEQESDGFIMSLFEPLPQHTDYVRVIGERLGEFEYQIDTAILQRFHYLLTHLAKSKDEYQYIQTSFYQLFNNLLTALKDFRSQPAAWMNQDAALLYDRMLAYVFLLDNRSNEIFSDQKDTPETDCKRQVRQLVILLDNIIRPYAEQLASLEEELKKLSEKLNRKPLFWQKWFKTHEKLTEKINHVKYDIAQTHQASYIQINSILHKHKNISALWQHQDIENERSAMLLAGENGMTKLPNTLMLPNRPDQFDMNQILSQLKDIHLGKPYKYKRAGFSF